MSQFRPRSQQPYSRSLNRDADVKLRMQDSPYKEEHSDTPYGRYQVDNQKIRNLSFWNNSDQQENEESEWSEHQSPIPFILGIVILVVASTFLWFLFRWASGENSSTPPIIPADTAPFKIRPENPGGMMIPHQDKLIYGRLRQDTPQPVEHLLPPPEQPIIVPPSAMNGPQDSSQMNISQQASAIAPQAIPPSMQVETQPQQSQTHPQNQEFIQPLQSYPPNATMHPVPQPQMQVQGYQVPLQGQTAYPQQLPQHPSQYSQQPPYGVTTTPPATMNAQPSIPHAPLQAASNPIPPKHLSSVENIKSASDEEDAGDLVDEEGQSELNQIIAKAADLPLKKSPKKLETDSTKRTPIGSGKHKVQIASLPSRVMAEQEIKRLRSHHAPLFQNRPWDIQRVSLGKDRGSTHRLVVGSFSNRNDAVKFCKKLRAEKIRCLVVAPASE